jgi:hypothetical protein
MPWYSSGVPARHLRAALPASPLRGHEGQHICRRDNFRGLPAAVKNTFKSYATASTVFGRQRPARNSRYSSASSSPSR